MVEFFFESYKDTSWLNINLEIVVFIFGILSVWYAGKENIWVFPTGLTATIISVYLLYLAGYLGDMILNGYYSIMSLYGWYKWSKPSSNIDYLEISRTNAKEKLLGFAIFMFTLMIIYVVYKLVGNEIRVENYIDVITSGIFFTAMYFMALKKIENWMLWIIGDIISIPLYAYRGLGILALQFVIFTVMAILAYRSWYKTIAKNRA